VNVKTQPKKILVLCILANDAEIVGENYRDVGVNYKIREKDAVSMVEGNVVATEVIWGFGRGTDPQRRSGPTLARLCEASLRLRLPTAKTLTNNSEHHYWGTLEEISWIVEEVGNTYAPSQVEFKFFTQRLHMDRVKLAWRLFFEPEWGRARFFTTGLAKGYDLSEKEERNKRLYYWAMRYSFGLLVPKHLDPSWLKRYKK